MLKADLNRIANEGPSEDELRAAKDYLTGSYPLGFDTSASVAGRLMGILVNDLGLDYFERRNDLVRARTLDDVKRAAKRTLGAGPISYVIVGQNAERILASVPRD